MKRGFRTFGGFGGTTVESLACRQPTSQKAAYSSTLLCSSYLETVPMHWVQAASVGPSRSRLPESTIAYVLATCLLRGLVFLSRNAEDNPNMSVDALETANPGPAAWPGSDYSSRLLRLYRKGTN